MATSYSRRGFDRALAAALDAGMAAVDAEGRQSFVSARFCEMVGWSAEELIGARPPFRYWPPEHVAEIQSAFASTLAGKLGAGGVDLVFCRKSGERFDVHVTVSALEANDGPSRWLACVNDLSERNRVIAQLREFDEQLRLMQFGIDQAAETVLWLRPDGRIVKANARAATMLGVELDEIIGAHLGKFDAALSEQAWPEQWAELVRRGSVTRQATFSTARGPVPVEVLTTFFEYDNAAYCIAIARDVSERLELEAQLLHAQKMEAIGRLAGGIAHDFNNLLAVIQSYAGFIRDELSPADPMVEDVKEIIAATERAASLAQRLLVFSRKQAPRARPLDLNEALGDLEKLLARTLGEDIRLTTLVEPSLGSVMVDPSQFDQLVVNLAVNARDAMPEGGELVIEADGIDVEASEPAPGRALLPPGRYARLKVRDTGSGMTAEVAARIFEPFFTTKGDGKGTGLGLAIVYGVVQAAGGRISVKSSPGKGTTFEILLPLLAGGGAQRTIPPPTDLYGHGETVLVVEDERAVRTAMARILSRSGYRVLQAGNAGEALLVAERRSDIDLLLTDVVMPQISGKELAARLLERQPSLRVAFVSGFAQTGNFDPAGMDRESVLIQKPFTKDSLLTGVSEALQRPPPTVTTSRS